MCKRLNVLFVILLFIFVSRGTIFAADQATQINFLLPGLIDSSGVPLNGGKVHTYEAGTLNAKTTWTDKAKSSAQTNPIILDSYGKSQTYADGWYKFIVKTSDDVTLYTLDNVYIDGGSPNVFYVNDYSSFSAAVTAIGSTECVLKVTANITVSTATTIAAQTHLVVEKGGGFTKSGTGTITINGTFETGLYTVFTGFSPGNITFGTGSVKAVNPKWWGAKGDASTNDSAAIQNAIDAYDMLEVTDGNYYLDTMLTVDNKKVTFFLNPNSILTVKNNNAGIKTINTGAVLEILGSGQINGFVGNTGYGIWITYGKVRIDNLQFFQTNNYSIFLDASTPTQTIAYSQIERVFLPDAWGIKIEGEVPGEPTGSNFRDIIFTGDTRSELFFIKNATDQIINHVVGGNNGTTTPSIRMEQAKGCMFTDVFVSAFQYYGFYIDVNSKRNMFNNCQTFDCKYGWYVNGNECTFSNIQNNGSDEHDIKIDTSGTRLIFNGVNNVGNADTTGAPSVIIDSTGPIDFNGVTINSSDNTYAFDIVPNNKTLVTNANILSSLSGVFEGQVLPARYKTASNTGNCIAENAGLFTANGGTSTYSFSHGLVPAIVPTIMNITPASADAGGQFYGTCTATAINITFAAPTPGGTNNIVLYWETKLTP